MGRFNDKLEKAGALLSLHGLQSLTAGAVLTFAEERRTRQPFRATDAIARPAVVLTHFCLPCYLIRVPKLIMLTNSFKALIALLISTAATAIGQNQIDFLDDGAFSFSDSQGGGATTLTVTGISTDSTLGGQRFLSLGAFGGTVSASLSMPFGAGANDDFAVFSATPGSQGSFSITIGQAADLNANFRDIPNSTNDWDRIRVTFAAGGSGGASLNVTIFSDGEGSATVAQSFGGGAGDVDFLQSAFMQNNPAFTENTFRDIDRVTVTVIGAAGGTYNIASIDRNGSVIPEPGSASLVGLGVVTLAALYWRQRRCVQPS